MKRNGTKRLALLAACLVSISACVNGSMQTSTLAGQSEVAAQTPLPTHSSVPTATPTAVPTATPEPTPSPTPDPLIRTWKTEGGTFALTLEGNGSYRASYGEYEATGVYMAEDGLLTLTVDGGRSDAVPYTNDGTALTLFYPEQTALPLYAMDGGVARSPEAPYSSEPDPETLPEIAYAYVNDAIVTVELKNGTSVSDYCFTCLATPPDADAADWLPVSGAMFRVFKYDGDYTIFVRDEQGRVSAGYPISVRSGYLYPIRAEGMTPLRTALSNAAETAGTSCEALQEAVLSDVAEAGVYTRCGVVTAAVSTVSHLGELGYSIPYQGHGAFQNENDWGLNPNWGAKLSSPVSDGGGTYYYSGMQCVGSIVWAYKQAGINLSNTNTGWQIGQIGERIKSGDNRIRYDQAQSGDLVQADAHFLMVVDRLDTDGDGLADSYLTYEMNAPHLTFLILTFRTVRYRTFYSMDAVFENEGRNRKHARFWEDTFLIPQEAMPQQMRMEFDEAATARAVDRLLRGVGLRDSEDAVGWRIGGNEHA